MAEEREEVAAAQDREQGQGAGNRKKGDYI
jgi:hypothetical protein